MSLAICEHVKPGGVRCGSPALSEQKYCHYHAGVHRVVPHTNLFVMAWNPTREAEPYNPCELPFLEDAAAIQIGFMQLINGVAQQRIEIRRAKLILSAMHGAAANLRQMDAALAKMREGPEETAGERRSSCGDGGKSAVTGTVASGQWPVAGSHPVAKRRRQERASRLTPWATIVPPCGRNLGGGPACSVLLLSPGARSCRGWSPALLR
jgi:hypothetical protein